VKFNKDHKVDPKTLNKIEGRAFIEDLMLEFDRHDVAFQQARFHRAFWDSAVKRHIEDREEIIALIVRVEKEVLGE